jgi:hypothetical protein
MRLSKTILYILFSGFILLYACSKEETNNDDNLTAPTPLSVGKLRATINGQEINFNLATSSIYTGFLNSSVILEGISDDNAKSITIDIVNANLYSGYTIPFGGDTIEYAQITYTTENFAIYTCNGETSKGKLIVSAYGTMAFRGNFWANTDNVSDITSKVTIIGEFNTILKNE